MRSRSYWRIALIVVACVGVGAVAYQLFTDRDGLGKLAHPSILLFAAASVLVQIAAQYLRSYKQRRLLEVIRPVRTFRVFEGQMIGFLFNTILPFRLGELVRAHYIGRAISISRSAVFATIVFERLLDSLVLAGAAFFVVIFAPDALAVLPAATWLLAIAVVLSLFLLLARIQNRILLRFIYATTGIFNQKIRDRLRMILWSVIYVLRTVITRKRARSYALLTVLMWSLYFLSAYIFVVGVIPGLTFMESWRSTLASFLGVSVPSGPAYLGSYNGIFALVSGLPAHALTESALPFSTWLLMILPPTVFGLAFLLTKRFGGTPDETGNELLTLENKLYRDVDITAEFSHFLDAYFGGDAITRIMSTQEFRGSFKVLRTFKGGSNALTVLVRQDDQTIVKKITLPQYAEKLTDQYRWLHDRSSLPQVARVQAYESHADYEALNIEYRAEYVPFFDFIHSHEVSDSQAVLTRVWEFMTASIHVRRDVPTAPAEILGVYIDTKVLQKAVDASKTSLELAQLLSYDEIDVNGRVLSNLAAVLQRITSSPEIMADLEVFTEGPIHGDLTIDNLMVDPRTGDFLVLDPNNENAISDPIVDSAKLMQSLHSGYEFLIGLREASVTSNQVRFEENRSQQYAQLGQSLVADLENVLPAAQFRALLFHEAVHYFRMLTYRANIRPDTAPAFYGIGVRLLNDFVAQYDRGSPATDGTGTAR